MTNSLASPRLIEKGFPCHQVGAETRRERNASSALPPHFFLHVWWARRPLTPSAAAILGSVVPADFPHEDFLRDIGLRNFTIETADGPLRVPPGFVDNGKVRITSSLLTELRRVNAQKAALASLEVNGLNSSDEAAWRDWTTPLEFDSLKVGEFYEVTVVAARPAFSNRVIDIEGFLKVRSSLDKYGYTRAYTVREQVLQGDPITVLDPTAGGGSIPLEALRLGANAIASELNPVASVILEATLRYPKLYGLSLIPQLEHYGSQLVDTCRRQLAAFFPPLSDEELDGFLHCRQITSPHCGKPVPLLNGTYLSKVEGDKWAVRLRPDAAGNDIEFEYYAADRGLEKPTDHGLHLIYDGKTRDWRTVQKGKAMCPWTGLEIDGDEIKRQAQAGEMTDRMFCVVAKRWVPASSNRDRGRWLARLLDPAHTARAGKQRDLIETLGDGWTEVDTTEFPTTVLNTLAKKGVIEIRKEKLERFFRAPAAADLAAFARAEATLRDKWAAWEEQGLIPKELIPPGQKTREPQNYGMPRWCDLFNPRQLLAHLTATEALLALKPRILDALGPDKGKAVITYLQFMIDKGLDYNSRQTLWHAARGVIAHTFTRHDYSYKWVYGELIYTGPSSGLAWGLSQILDAYGGLAGLLEDAPGSVEILNGSAARIDGIPAASVDVIVNDPPYYDNVQYAELSDFFYAWQRRTLADLYPGFFLRRETDKQKEAVANPVRDGSAKTAKREYEDRMREIYAECRRVLKADGVMTIMFTHKKADAWDTLTRALITSGWRVTSTYPIESESTKDIHHAGKAAAASSLFLVCRKRDESRQEPAAWRLGEGGVQAEVDAAVRASLPEFEALGLSPVDRMVAAYGRALQVLSDRWPVLDGEEEISPAQAIAEASLVVAEREVERITGGALSVSDLNPEAALAVIAFGIWGIGFADKPADRFVIPFDALNQVSRSLGIRLEQRDGGYRLDPEARVAALQRRADAFHAPFEVSGSNLRLVLPEERAENRADKPATEWDALHGILRAYRRGEIPLVRAYLKDHARFRDTALKLLRLWSEQIIDPELTKEAKLILLEL